MKSEYDDNDTPRGDGFRFAVVVSEWYKEHTQVMVAEARALLTGKGAEQVEIFWAPGAFEIPVIAHALCKTERYAAILAFGAVLRGETRHFDMLLDGVTQGLMILMMQTGLPIVNEIIGADEIAHIAERSKPGKGNKGREAAIAALKAAAVIRDIRASVR